MSPTDLVVQKTPAGSINNASLTISSISSRHRQQVGQPDRQYGPAAVDSADGRARVGQEHVPVEHRGAADLFFDSGVQARLRGPQEEVDFLVTMNPETAKEERCSRSGRAAVV